MSEIAHIKNIVLCLSPGPRGEHFKITPPHPPKHTHTHTLYSVCAFSKQIFIKYLLHRSLIAKEKKNTNIKSPFNPCLKEFGHLLYLLGKRFCSNKVCHLEEKVGAGILGTREQSFPTATSGGVEEMGPNSLGFTLRLGSGLKW